MKNSNEALIKKLEEDSRELFVIKILIKSISNDQILGSKIREIIN